jgi:hypothetical protein
MATSASRCLMADSCLPELNPLVSLAHGWLDVPHERIEPWVPGYGQHVPFSSIA